LEQESNFVEFLNPKRIWAIGSIHSNLESLESLNKYIFNNFKEGDKLIFLGNVIGLGLKAKETLSNIIKLRFNLMAKFKLKPDDIIFLRGAQEEMFNKLLQLQIAPNPKEILDWMFEHGVDSSLNSYGFSKDELYSVASTGTINISKWTSRLNNQIKQFPGHKEYFSNLKHAVYTSSKKILFVNRGVDISRPLSAQNDCFWWGYQNFSKINTPYKTFIRIVRGYQSIHNNNLEMAKNSVICTLFKQPFSNNKIIAGLFENDGKILEIFESN
tara:strand:+ start:6751 stop:7563 length:813 start_codon:yes stop_codon:yes gene_type:complete